MTPMNRRMIIAGASASAVLGLAGCVSTTPNPSLQAGVPAAPSLPAAQTLPPLTPVQASPLAPPQSGASEAVADAGGDAKPVGAMYGPVSGEPFPVPAVKTSEVNRAFLRTNVAYATNEPPGTIVVDPVHHYLYFVEAGGRATRYGVGVGKAGFVWSGEATIKSKQEWPDWYPPKEMIARRPDLKQSMNQLQSGEGMHGGPRNPLGARAMYLWQGDKDTLFRIHGTVEPWTIGQSVSSGCIRMINQDVIDLYNRTPVGTRVVVLGNFSPKVAHN